MSKPVMDKIKELLASDMEYGEIVEEMGLDAEHLLTMIHSSMKEEKAVFVVINPEPDDDTDHILGTWTDVVDIADALHKKHFAWADGVYQTGQLIRAQKGEVHSDVAYVIRCVVQ